jgi:hypothetical protein
MAYDEGLADRVRAVLSIRPELTERKMFGGIAFMLSGNMAVGVTGDELIIRVAPEDYERALAEPGARQFDFTGKPMRGFVCVGGEAIAADDDFAGWVDSGADRAASLPPK